MAITTDSTVNVTSGGITYDRIGFSKTLDNYSIDEIVAFTYCAGDNTLIKHITEKQNDTLVNTLNGVDVPVHVEQSSATIMVANAGVQANENQGEKGVYCGVVWLSKQSAGLRYVITSSSISDYKIVTEFRAKDYVYDLNSPAKINCGGQIYGTTDWSGSDQTAHEVWYNTGGSLVYYSDNYGTVTIDVSSYRIDPYLVFKYNDKVYFFKLTMAINEFYSNHNNGYENPVTASSYSSYDGTTAISVSAAIEQLWNSSWSNISWNFPQNWTKTGGGAYGWSYTGLCFDAEISQYGLVNGTNSSLYSGCSLKFYFNTRDAALDFWKCCGVKFYADKIYKPIIVDGYVTGYTDNLDTASELDNWTGASNHTVPGSRPTPTPSEGDDIDDHEMGAGSGISGMANLWLLTKSQLDDLHSAFNTAPGGFDPMNSLISVMGLGVAPTYLFDDIEVITPINIRKSDGTSWSTGVEGHIVASQKSAFQFTGITVNRKYNNFLDFSPYAVHEIFIPMCGWLTLPDIAVDRSITVTYLPDAESLKCRAVVSVVDNSGNRCVIGEKDGIMGADVPFTNTGHSLYVGEAIINGMNVAGEVITGAIGAGFTKTNAKGGTYRPYEGFTVGMGGTLPGAIGNAIVSGQTNRTHYMTGNGTRIGFSDGENIQIKSTYHNIDKPTNYDHTVGKVCNKTGLLSSFNGFTVCDNPHINISALEEEKSEIKALLEQGVILPSGE